MAEFRAAAERGVAEDLGAGDPTGAGAGVSPAAAVLVTRRPGVVAGLPGLAPVAAAVSAYQPDHEPASVQLVGADGQTVPAGAVLARLTGPAASLLAAERTMLNLLGHLSGVATTTARFVAAVAGTGVVVRDTRKTTLGLRVLEKYAVRIGGGTNHRMGLGDALLVKDNHIAALGGLGAAVRAARRTAPGLPLEVEVESLEQVVEALDLGCDLLLLDNMDLDTLAAAVALAAGRARTEASGGITVSTARTVAETGVDYLAVGALTHSAPALDIGVDWVLP
ncbi:MAG: carboxylating nicotinate-nucleotide diphosphorylase [Actinomycetes bacterium]